MGGKCIMTSEDCAKGSDRAYEALQAIPNKKEIKFVINIQGDMPFLDPNITKQAIDRLKNSDFDIVTPLAKVSHDVASNPSNVKAVVDSSGRVLYLSCQMIPYDA